MATTTGTDQANAVTADIEAEIAAARERLADDLADLIERIHPRAVLRNSVDGARTYLAAEARQVSEQFVDENGLRTSRVVLAAAAVAGAVGFAWIIRSIFNGR